MGRAEGRAIVVVAAAVPLAVPRRFERRREACGLAPVGRRCLGVAGAFTHPGHAVVDVEQEEAEPCALAAAGRAHEVHAVVPVAAAEERQAVLPAGARAVHRAAAMIEHRAGLGPDLRLVVRLDRVRGERRSDEERHHFMQQRLVARLTHVFGDRERQPQQVVGTPRAQAPARGLVPPVLHVPFDELPAGGPQQVRACDRGRGMAERQHVLDLIAEAEGAARLEVPRARVDAARQRLVQQPRVHHRVERVVGRPHLHRIQQACPVRFHAAARLGGAVHLCEAGGERLRMCLIVALAEHDHEFRGGSRAERDPDVERGAGVEATAETRHQAAHEPGGRIVCAMAPEERHAIAGGGARRM